MPPAEITFDNTRRAAPVVRVYRRANWTDVWTEETRLRCDYVLMAAGPAMGKAKFTWQFGRVLHPDTDAWESVAPLDVLREYVKVEIDNPSDAANPIRWHGVFEEEASDERDVLEAPDEDDRAGRQTLVAYALDIMLARQILTRSVASGAGGVEVSIQRAIEFNTKIQLDSLADKSEKGNRSEHLGPAGTYLFATEMDNAEFWSTLDAVEYLLEYHVPRDVFETVVVPWELGAGGVLGDLPFWDKPRVACHNRSLRDVLVQLVDRRRMLGFTTEVVDGVDGAPDVIQLRTFTFTAVDVEYEGNTITANRTQKSLVFDDTPGLQSAVRSTDAAATVGEVVCSGARAVSCFTLEAATGTLVAGWTAAQEVAYEQGASAVPGYGAMARWEQELRNKHARALASVARVYSYFNAPAEWDGTGVQGLYFEDPENVLQPLPLYLPQLRLNNRLPLKTDHDYTGDRIAEGEVADDTPPGGKWEFQPILVAIGLPDTAPQRYQPIDLLSVNTEIPRGNNNTDDGIKWSASIRPQQDALGLVITVSGQPQYAIASADFAPLAADAAELATHDWNTLVATVAMEVDRHVEGRWPVGLPEFSEAVRRLVVDLGDEYQLHYVAKGTVVEIDDAGALSRSTNGGFIRDDRAKLTALARLVYEWYGQERQSIELSFGYVVGSLAVGDLITTVGADPNKKTVNSVVTEIKYEFPPREGAAATTAKTTVSTQFAELDVKQLRG